MRYTAAVREAKSAFERKAGADKETRINNVVSLAEWQVYSNRQISTFTGMDPHDVAAWTKKTDRTGGNLTGEALGPILEVIAIDARSEVDDYATKRALDAGCSTRMLARLTGLTQSSITRAARRAA